MANKVQLEAILKFVGIEINPGLFNQISRAAAGMPGPVQQMNQNLQQSVGAANNVNKAVKGVHTQLTASERVAKLFLQRMTQFAILLPTFVTLNKTIQGSVKFLFEFDSAIRDIMKADVGGLSGQFNEIAKSAFKLSDEFGVSATEAANTIKTYIQAGFDLKKANDLAGLSILGVRASTLDAAGSVEFLLSATKQFKLEGQDLAKALDALVTVEGVSASEAKDVADAFSTGGNSLAEFSKNINDSIGLIAALREQTRKSGNEIGTFFKTLQTRIFAAGDSRSAIEGIGVSVKNLDGTLRPTMDVLNDLKTAFAGLTEEQQVNAAKTIAGVRQFEGLIATLNSLDRANQLSVDASQASGAAKEKEAVDAQKLSRQFDALVKSAQELAFALGQNSGSSFIKEILHDTKLAVDSITRLIELFDKLKVPVLPILAPLALKGLGKVLGFGGGAPATGGTTTTTTQTVGGGPNSPLAASQQSQIVAIRQLTATINSFAAQMKILMQATMTQSQLVQSNIALDKLQNEAIMLNTQAQREQAKIIQTTTTVSGSAAKEAFKSIATYTALTVAASAVTSGMNYLAESVGGTTGQLLKSTSTSLQTGLQFGILGLKAGVLAGTFTAVAEAANTLIEAYVDNKKAVEEVTQAGEKGGKERNAGNKLVSGFSDVSGFTKALSQSVENKSRREVNIGKLFESAFSHFDEDIKKGFGDASKFSEAFFSNLSVSFKIINELSGKMETNVEKGFGANLINTILTSANASIKNKDALAEYTTSLDGAGKSTLSYRDQLNLFLAALGLTNDAVSKLTGRVNVLALTFEGLKIIEATTEMAQSVNHLSEELIDAKKTPLDLANNFNKLARDANNSQRDFEAAQASFNKFTEVIKKGMTGVDTDNAQQIMHNLSDLLNTPGVSNQAISSYITTLDSEDQQKFAKEYVELVKNKNEAELNAFKANQAIQVEASKRLQEQLRTEKEATLAAADSLSKFRTELVKVGATTANTDMFDKITKLTPMDVGSIFAGASDLPDEIQDILKNTFINPVKKAHQELENIGQEKQSALEPITKKIAYLTDEIARLGNAVPGSSNALLKQELANQLVAKQIEKTNTEYAIYIKALEAARNLATAVKKAQEDEAKTEAERAKKIQAVTDAGYNFNKALHDINKGFQQFINQHIDEAAQKEADAYQNLKSTQQEVLGATKDLATAHRDFVAVIIQVNGAMVEAKVKANLLGRDIGMLNGNIVTFKDKLSSLNNAFTDGMRNASMTLEQRIQLEQQLAEQTLSFLKEASDQIQSAGLNIFGQTAGENQGLQKGIAGLSFIADKLGGSFKNFESLKPQDLDKLGKELLNLPVEFRKNILDALSFLPSTSSIGGFNVDQLKQAIGQIGAGVNPEQGLPALSDLNAQQIDQLKILGQLGNQQAKLQLTQVVVAQQQLAKAQEQLDIAKIQEDRAKEGLDEVRGKVTEELAVLEQANNERRDLLQRVIEADNVNTLHSIESDAQLFANQTATLDKSFRDIGEQVSSAIASAISAKTTAIEANQSLNTFNTIENLKDNSRGYIPNYAGGNLTPGEAGGILRAAMREKSMMPNGAQLAVANTHEAIIPMHRGFVPNFAEGTPGGSAIAAGIANVRSIDQTMVAAIARSVSDSLSQLSGSNNNSEQLDKIASLLTDLNSSLGQVKDSNNAIQANTAVANTGGTTATPTVARGQEVKISLETNQNNTLQITGLESLRDQLRQAISETTSKQVDKQLEALMTQLDGVFQVLNQRGLITSFGTSR